jgi:hypothetical protein
MPIFQYIPKEKYDESNPLHSKDQDFNGHVNHYEQLHTGLVVAVREENGYNDSDWYATVYDEEKDTFFEVLVGTTRCYFLGGHEIDASDEIKQKWNDLMKKQAREREAAYYLAKRMKVGEGKTVEFVKGRKIPIGTKGVVTWLGIDKYDPRKEKLRVGVKLENGDFVYTTETNLKVLIDERGKEIEA